MIKTPFPGGASALAMALILGPSAAAEPLWSSGDLELDTRHQNVLGEVSDTTTAPITIRCTDAGYCGESAADRTEAADHAAAMGERILEIREWYDATGLLPSNLHLRDNARRINLTGGTAGDGSLARVHGQENMSSLNMQVGTRVITDLTPEETDVTLAHEWLHTAKGRTPERSLAADEGIHELQEALAEAVGLAFGYPDTDMIDARQPLDLDRPFFEGEYGGYEKAPYILFVGDRLGARNQVAHIRNIMDQLDDDGMRGLSYLYDPSFDPYSFDRAFPKFVALMNQPKGEDYYRDVARKSWEAGSHGALKPLEEEVDIQPNAAAAFLLETIEVADLPEDPRERVVIGELGIDSDEAPIGTHINMIYEHELINEGRFSWMMKLDGANDGPFLRATNVDPEPKVEKSRKATFNGTLEEIFFELPECMSPGATRQIRTDGASPEMAENFELTASSGTIEGFDFTAPEQPGTVAITLEIASTITRGSTITGAQRPRATVDLGSVDVQAAPCMIRMSVGPTVMTYVADPNGPFTKFTNSRAPEMRIFAREDEMIGRFPGQGWQPVPPQMREMFTGDMSSDNMLGNAVPGPGTPFNMSNFPRQFTEHLSWENVRGADDGAGAPVEYTSTQCRDGGDGCIRATHGAGSLVFDDQRRLVQFNAGPHPITFEYGAFDVSRPPDW